jgi:hypothetical protein
VNEVLLSAGVAAIVIAIVGGGASALGFTIPKLESGRRQIALGLVGVAFLAAAIILREDDSNGPDVAVTGYREEVLATCRALPRTQPTPTAGISFEKAAYLEFLSTQRGAWRSSLADLWEQEVPDSLRDDRRAARAATARLMERWGTVLELLEQQLPERFDVPAAAQYAQSTGATLAAPASRWERAMSRLAGAPCTPPGTSG